MTESARVLIVSETAESTASGEAQWVQPSRVKSWLADGSYARRVRSFDAVEFRLHSLETGGRLLPFVLLLPLLSAGTTRIVDGQGVSQPIDARFIARLVFELIGDVWASLWIPGRVRGRLRTVEPRRVARTLSADGGPLYLRTDLVFGLASGGSVGHIAGVLNNLGALWGRVPLFVTTDAIPTVASDVETHVLPPVLRHRNLSELRMAVYGIGLPERVIPLLEGAAPAFIYQRYGLLNFSGLDLSNHYGVPFVLEYNGSEVWMARHWGKPLRNEALAGRVEDANLEGADLIVVVSAAMRDELVARGVDADKVLVNPNGVDADRYSPSIDGSEVRRRRGLADKTVVGFIGTMGPWHGAEVLADSFGRLIEREPALRDRLRLLLVGDGVQMGRVREQIARHGIEDLVICTGAVPQEQGPAHLAAMDILASPHVPNPDGTPFFGSPTKLFEYMAMGRGIVASDLDQIGEVLEHGRTAWMVTPGDPEALAEGIRVLANDRELCERLGRAARDEVVARYTWNQHTQRILDALRRRCGRAAASGGRA